MTSEETIRDGIQMKEQVLARIRALLSQEQILVKEKMSEHTTFQIGGFAAYFLIPKTEEEAVALLRLLSAEKEPFFILGNGSNLLVSDAGYRGCVVLIDQNLSEMTVNGNEIKAQAGTLLVRIAARAQKAGLTGFEFASGIPGTLGGGITMNAGAYGGEMKDVIQSVRLYDFAAGVIVEKSAEEMNYGYRNSLVKQGDFAVLSAVLRLENGDAEAIRARMEELKERRLAKQPLDFPSAGSTFKRPAGYFAGKLIQDAGLQGFRVGGAQISEKHSGFVINLGDATAEDVLALIREVRSRVAERFSVDLEPEVCMLGEDMKL